MRGTMSERQLAGDDVGYPGIKHLSRSICALYSRLLLRAGSGAQGLPRSGLSPRNSASPRAQQERGNFCPAASSVVRDTATADHVASWTLFHVLARKLYPPRAAAQGGQPSHPPCSRCRRSGLSLPKWSAGLRAEVGGSQPAAEGAASSSNTQLCSPHTKLL